MSRKRTRLASQVWTVIFLLFFNDALAQTTIASVGKSSLPVVSSKIAQANRTVLRKIVAEDSKTKISTELVSNEKQGSIVNNSSKFQDQVETISTREPLKQKHSKKSTNEEKIKADEEPASTTPTTIDSLSRTILIDRVLKSKTSENNVSDKSPKLIPDDESLPKVPRNKGKPIFLDAFKEGSRNNVKKSETLVTPEFEGTEDYEIEDHELDHKEPTTTPTTKNKDSMKGLEDFDLESSKRDETNDEKEDKIDEKEEKIDDKEETFKEDAPNEETLSLANDTNVNFSHVNKSQHNDTNSISENDDAIEVDFGPKHEIEVVKNATDSPLIRLVQASEDQNEDVDLDESTVDKRKKSVEQVNENNSTTSDDDNSDPAPSVNDVDLKNDKIKLDISSKTDVFSSKTEISPSKTEIFPSKTEISPSKTEISPPKTEISPSKTEIPPSEAANSLPSITEKTIASNISWIEELANGKEILEKKESLEKKETFEKKETLEKKELTESSLNPERNNSSDSVSPSPKARTISFSGINEFIPDNADSKIVLSKTTSNESPVTKKPFLPDKEIEQRPYPYLKTDPKKPIDEAEDMNKPTSFDKRIEESTEEVLAYENTIGRRESDKKLVITEPSVVIENSIQQFKPTYYKRSGNATRINSTISDFGLKSTTSRNFEEKNVTSTIERYVPSSSTIRAILSGEEITLTTEKEQKLGNLSDNAITEINPKYVSSDEFLKETSSSLEDKVTRKIEKTLKEDFTERSVETTKKENKFPEDSKIDVQTSAEDSKLSFSHMNATESLTEHPMKKIEESQTESSPWTTSTAQETPVTTEKAVLSTTQIPKNVNKSEEILNNTTPSLIEQLETTTTIEYEFVGLKETTISGEEDGLSESDMSVTMPSTFRDEKTESISESSTFSPRMFDQEGTTIPEREELVTTETSLDEKIPSRSTKENSTEEKLTEEKSTTEAETMESDETLSFLTTTSSNQDDSVRVVSETTMDNGNVTLDDLNSSTESDTFKRNVTNTTIEMNTDSKLPTTTEADKMTTVTEYSVAMDTTVMWTSTYATSPKIVPVSTENTVLKSTTEISTDAPPSLAPEDIKLLVRIVFEGTWSDVCPRLQLLKEMLAESLTTGTQKVISPKQVIFHQTQCTEGVVSMASSSETPLTSLLIYVIDENGDFDESMTKMLPGLYKMSPIPFPLPVHSFLLVQEADTGNAIAVVVVSSVAFICLVLLAGLLFIMRKRQTRFNYGERCRPVSLDAYSLDSVSAYNSVRRKGAIRASKRSYGNPTFEDSSAIPSHPLNFAGLSSFCNDVNAISEEFTGVPQITAKIDELPQGAEVKNRYANVIPLPETRVPLQRVNNDPLTEYINASYVRGPKNATKYYIACQGPTESTVTEFWRMIWEQQCKVIIMLTDLVENGVEKCSEYIPPSEVTDCHRLFGDYQVTLKKRETKEKYAISSLHLKNLENNTFREVSHIWYLWPANGVPDSASLIAVLLEARALQRGGPGPIVVHCSPGTGRTGTLIALDLGIRQYEITRTVDVPRVVYTIRRDRAGAVQTKEQYAFIYKALNLYATKLSGGALEST